MKIVYHASFRVTGFLRCLSQTEMHINFSWELGYALN